MFCLSFQPLNFSKGSTWLRVFTHAYTFTCTETQPRIPTYISMYLWANYMFVVLLWSCLDSILTIFKDKQRNYNVAQLLYQVYAQHSDSGFRTVALIPCIVDCMRYCYDKAYKQLVWTTCHSWYLNFYKNFEYMLHKKAG